MAADQAEASEVTPGCSARPESGASAAELPPDPRKRKRPGGATQAPSKPFAADTTEVTSSDAELGEHDAVAALLSAGSELLNLVEPADFTLPLAGYAVELFKRMRAAGEPVDRVTTPAFAERHDGVRPYSVHLGSSLLAWTADRPAVPIDLAGHVRPVVERAARRRLVEACRVLAAAAETAPVVALRDVMAAEFRSVAAVLDRAEAVVAG